MTATAQAYPDFFERDQILAAFKKIRDKPGHWSGFSGFLFSQSPADILEKTLLFFIFQKSQTKNTAHCNALQVLKYRAL